MDLPFDRDDDYVGDSGIPVHDTMFMLDSSKLQQLMDCPRGFFFRYILGWQEKEPNIHLVFGSAWHEAMRHLLEHGPGKDSVMEAYDKFMEVYQEEFGRHEFTSEHYSKNPDNVVKGLAQYVKKFSVDPSNTIYTEVAGATPIDPGRQLHFKVDAIRKHPYGHEKAGEYYVLEHKTTSRKTQSWMDKWNYKFQVGTYIHALNSWLEDPSKLDGLTINGSIFRKNDIEHVKIPIAKTGQQMLEWLFEANYWWDFYERNMRLLAQEVDPSDQVMVAFPRNTESCAKFGCKFKGICNVRPNPCQNLRMPQQYEREFWDPRRREQESNYRFDPETNKIVEVEETEEDDTDDSSGKQDLKDIL